MSNLTNVQNFPSIAALLKIFFILSLLAIVQSCIPAIEKSYLTPEIKGKLVSFTPNKQRLFTPIEGAKIYNPLYPDTPVYTDKEGHFLLPAYTKIEAKLLMVGHSNTYYPVVIEKGPLRYETFAVATSNMRFLEKVDLHSIIVEPVQNAHDNDPDVAMKAAWPCNVDLIHHLDFAVSIAKKLSDAATNNPFLTTDNYIANHYEHTLNLLSLADNSCQWQEISDEKQFRQLQETKEYFDHTLDTLNSLFARPTN